MKRAAVLVAIVLVLAPSIASADRGHRARRIARFHRIVRKLDVNGDGVVDKREAGNRFRKLRRFDTDGDGWVTAREIASFRRRR